MKVVLTTQDLLPLVQDLVMRRYPEADKVTVQFVMKRKPFSLSAEMTVECEIEKIDRS